jgi:hypothetical protein
MIPPLMSACIARMRPRIVITTALTIGSLWRILPLPVKRLKVDRAVTIRMPIVIRTAARPRLKATIRVRPKTIR